MNLPGMTARAATHSIIMGSLLSGLKDTHYTPPLPPPRENKNTPYPAPQSTCCQLQKWKWYQVSLVNSCNPPKPLYKLPREKFTIAVNLACTRAVGSTPISPTPQELRGSTQQAKRCLYALLEGKQSSKDQQVSPKRTRWGSIQEEVMGGLRQQLTTQHHGCTSLLVFSRKDKFCMFMNKTAQTKVVSAAHPQLKYSAQHLSNSPSVWRGWCHSSQQC